MRGGAPLTRFAPSPEPSDMGRLLALLLRRFREELEP
jgi:hypothetical protein